MYSEDDHRFKELDLVNRVPEDLWTEVHNIVQEAANKIIPKKGNAKECSNYCTVKLISHTSKAMLKIL